MEVILTPKIDGEFNTMKTDLHLKISKEIEFLEKYGQSLKYPHVKMIRTGIYELRALGNPQVRMFYTFKKGRAFIFDYYIKTTQKIPQLILKRVMKRYREIS